MRRAALFLTIGVALVTAGTFSYGSHGQSRPDSTGVIAALAERPRGTAELAAFYDAAARADRRALEMLLTQAAALRDQSIRAFALDALVRRYAELDGGGAIAAAERLQLPPSTIAALYHAWLMSAPTAALDALDELDDAKARDMAAGLLALIGDDELLVNRVLAVFPPAVADSLIGISLNRVAQDSPADAFARAREIFDPVARDRALRNVLFVWAERDPLAALHAIDSLDDEALRELFRNGLWQQLATAVPELMLERVGTFPTEFRVGIEMSALQALAQRDPRAVMDRLAQTPPGPMRQQLVQTIARSFAERDADGALAWVRSLQPPDPNALAIVVYGIASKDPLRAFELAAEISSPMEQAQALHAVLATATSDPGMSRTLLDRVLALPNNPQRQSLVQTAVASWASRAPAEAAEWLLANAERAPPEVVAQVAAQYAQIDRARATSYADRMPGDARAAWLRGVASAYAASDPRGAFEWVEQFRGRPEYDDAALAVLQSGAQYDPAAAVRILESIGRDEYRRGVTPMIAMRWANQDPAAAASWAASQNDLAVRQGAVSSVAQFWATQDATAARAWTLAQPSGAARDGALIAVLGVAARSEPPDTSLLSAFSTDQARFGGVQAATMGIAQRDPDEARQFVEAHVTDPSQRDRLLAMVTQMSSARFRIPVGVPPPFTTPSFGPVMPTQMSAFGVTPSGAVNRPATVDSLGTVRSERVPTGPAPSTR